MDNDFQKMISGANDAQLAEYESAVRAAREAKRPGVDLNDIKPGMSAEDIARVRAEISRALSGR